MELHAKKITQLIGHDSAVYCVAGAAIEGHIYSGGGDRVLAEWDLETGKAVGVAARTPGVIYSSCVLAGESMLLVGNNQGGIHVIDLQRKAEVKYLLAHQEGVFKLFQDPGKQLFYALGADGSFSVWDSLQFTCVYRKQLCKGKLRDVNMSPSGNHLAIACGDGVLRLFSADDFQELDAWQAHEGSLNALAYHPEGNYLLSGGKDAHLNVWDPANPGKPLESIPAHNYAIYSIVFHPDGDVFATGSRDKTIKIWDASSVQFLLRIDKELHQGHLNSVNSLHWSTFRNYLISASDDRSLIVWELSKG
jgi:WD repeat-containing protein 61